MGGMTVKMGPTRLSNCAHGFENNNKIKTVFRHEKLNCYCIIYVNFKKNYEIVYLNDILIRNF